MGFAKGLAAGLLFGGVLGALTNKRAGSENRQRLTAWGQDTAKDVKALQDGSHKLQTAMAKLQRAQTDQLTPAVQGIQKDVTAFNFKIAPHLQKIEDSLTRINDAIPNEEKLN